MADNRGGGLLTVPILLAVAAVMAFLFVDLRNKTEPSHGISSTIGIARHVPSQDPFQH